MAYDSFLFDKLLNATPNGVPAVAIELLQYFLNQPERLPEMAGRIERHEVAKELCDMQLLVKLAKEKDVKRLHEALLIIERCRNWYPQNTDDLKAYAYAARCDFAIETCRTGNIEFMRLLLIARKGFEDLKYQDHLYDLYIDLHDHIGRKDAIDLTEHILKHQALRDKHVYPGEPEFPDGFFNRFSHAMADSKPEDRPSLFVEANKALSEDNGAHPLHLRRALGRIVDYPEVMGSEHLHPLLWAIHDLPVPNTWIRQPISVLVDRWKAEVQKLLPEKQ